jgi:hypothetical protein
VIDTTPQGGLGLGGRTGVVAETVAATVEPDTLVPSESECSDDDADIRQLLKGDACESDEVLSDFGSMPEIDFGDSDSGICGDVLPVNTESGSEEDSDDSDDDLFKRISEAVFGEAEDEEMFAPTPPLSPACTDVPDEDAKFVPTPALSPARTDVPDEDANFVPTPPHSPEVFATTTPDERCRAAGAGLKLETLDDDDVDFADSGVGGIDWKWDGTPLPAVVKTEMLIAELGCAAAAVGGEALAPDAKNFLKGKGTECLTQRGTFTKSTLGGKPMKAKIPIPPRALGDKSAAALGDALEFRGAVEGVKKYLRERTANAPARKVAWCGACALPLIHIVLSVCTDAAGVNIKVVRDALAEYLKANCVDAEIQILLVMVLCLAHQVHISSRSGISALAAGNRFISGLSQTCCTFSTAAYTSKLHKTCYAFFSGLRIVSVADAAAESIPVADDDERHITFELLFYLLRWTRRDVKRTSRFAKALHVILGICNVSWQWVFAGHGESAFNMGDASLKWRTHVCSNLRGPSDNSAPTPCSCRVTADATDVIGGRGSRGGRGAGSRGGRCCHRRGRGRAAAAPQAKTTPTNLPGWLATSFGCVLNFHIGKFSMGRWTCASPAMAAIALWQLLGLMGGYAMNNSFDYSKVETKAAAPEDLPDSSVEWQRECE